jgi:hypothetical protein
MLVVILASIRNLSNNETSIWIYIETTHNNSEALKLQKMIPNTLETPMHPVATPGMLESLGTILKEILSIQFSNTIIFKQYF